MFGVAGETPLLDSHIRATVEAANNGGDKPVKSFR